MERDTLAPWAHWRLQVRVLLWKQLLLKKRARLQTFAELGFSIYFIMIIVILNFATGASKTIAATLTSPPTPVLPIQAFCKLQQAPGCIDFAYVPDGGSFVQGLVAEVARIPGLVVQAFATPEALAAAANAQPATVWGGIIFNQCGGSACNYTIRVGQPLFSNTSGTFELTGYLSLQKVLHQALLGSPANATWVPSGQALPTPTHTASGISNNFLWQYYFLFIFTYLTLQLTIQLVTEKSKKIRQGFQMAGMWESAYWVSTILASAITGLLIVLIFIVAVYAAQVVKHSNVFLVFIVFLAFSVSQIGVGIAAAAFFNSPRVASGFAMLLLLVMVGGYAAVENLLMPKPGLMGLKTLLALVPAVPFGHFINLMAISENAGVGLGFDSGSYGKDTTGFPMDLAVFMVFLDSFLMLALGLYLDQVVPNANGSSKSKIFCIFWALESCRASKKRAVGDARRLLATDDSHEPLVKLQALSKTFAGSPPKVAVDSVDLTVDKGEIHCVLGHNGAGKTTTISMLTGLIAPTSGDAFLGGYSIVNEREETKKLIGVCPQHDILLDTLTAREHLTLFCGLKGVPPSRTTMEVQEKLEELGLTANEHQFAKDFSGGMKRKLSVAIAFAGDSPVVFLDEPSSGMDPHARRTMWGILQRQKTRKAIVMTTHYMEEADALGDRITIMADGKVKVTGQTLFLKAHFGLGYHLHFVGETGCDRRTVGAFVEKHIQDTRLHNETGAEFTYLLPLTEVKKFPSLSGAIKGHTRADSELRTIHGYA